MPSKEWFLGSYLLSEWMNGYYHPVVDFQLFDSTQRQSLKNQITGREQNMNAIDQTMCK
jgi:hypothetical protein